MSFDRGKGAACCRGGASDPVLVFAVGWSSGKCDSLVSKYARVSLAAAVATTLLVGAQAQAQTSLTLGGLFQDHAVLQRDRPIEVWGHAGNGEEITVSIAAGAQSRQCECPALDCVGTVECDVAGHECRWSLCIDGARQLGRTASRRATSWWVTCSFARGNRTWNCPCGALAIPTAKFAIPGTTRFACSTWSMRAV